MDIQTLKLEDKLEKANESIRELYDILFFEDDEFEKVFGIQLGDKKGAAIHDEFIIECFCVGFGIDSQSDLKNTLKRGGYSEIESTTILRNFDLNFLPAFKELSKTKEVKTKENNTGDSKTNVNQISHLDLLSEIENPTPSISTTANFQNAAPKTESKETTQKNPTPNSPIKNQSTETSLHSSTPVAPYINPALNIATKLDQKLSAPSSSIPKDVYVSKKPDPYHEPVEL
jgi:hypothetical protein